LNGLLKSGDRNKQTSSTSSGDTLCKAICSRFLLFQTGEYQSVKPILMQAVLKLPVSPGSDFPEGISGIFQLFSGNPEKFIRTVIMSVPGTGTAHREGLRGSFPSVCRQYAVVYTDFWKSYNEVFPPGCQSPPLHDYPFFIRVWPPQAHFHEYGDQVPSLLQPQPYNRAVSPNL